VKSVRHSGIVATIQREGFVSVRDIAKEWRVSLMTARRDIRDLADAGLVRQRSSGAVARAAPVTDLSVDAALATYAASLATPGMTIGIAAGHAAQSVARALKGLERATFVTNSLAAADVLLPSSRTQREVPTVLVLPGPVDREGETGGELCVQTIGEIYMHLAILSVQGFDSSIPSFSTSLNVAEVARAFRRSSEMTIAIATSSHWAVRSQVATGKLTERDLIVTEQPQTDRDTSAIERARASIVLV